MNDFPHTCSGHWTYAVNWSKETRAVFTSTFNDFVLSAGDLFSAALVDPGSFLNMCSDGNSQAFSLFEDTDFFVLSFIQWFGEF